ncbi:MAG: flagellar basal body rod protein FlgC [Magnetococcales bacterium]|nr:flagellar basal body rod protein FlgC [Magnetococcales bacterium]MBF0149900.1 flagellar basal body rod protein FlgC [Magnetococcales bacterium]MBF0346555.1 flagellar basal body rod protein FlgC [Magnetococcales bacterium]MBF0632017.1 flagellar basal body rod protein FlgC [Magnetococcales bacterium]
MDFLNSFQVTSSGLAAQRLRMNIIAENVANAQTTRTPEGGPYKRKDPIFAAKPFKEMLSLEEVAGSTGVSVERIQVDERPPRMQYDPNHPDANADGYVAMPNIDMVTEMVNMMSASRSYESNVTVLNASKAMAMKALEIGR